MSKPKSSAPASAGGTAAPTEPPTFRSNPEVDAMIGRSRSRRDYSNREAETE